MVVRNARLGSGFVYWDERCRRKNQDGWDGSVNELVEGFAA